MGPAKYHIFWCNPWAGLQVFIIFWSSTVTASFLFYMPLLYLSTVSTQSVLLSKNPEHTDTRTIQCILSFRKEQSDLPTLVYHTVCNLCHTFNVFLSDHRGSHRHSVLSFSQLFLNFCQSFCFLLSYFLTAYILLFIFL